MITFRKHVFSICAVSAIGASSFAIAGPAQVQTVKAAPVISFDPVAEGFEPYTEPMEAAVISTDPVADGFHIKAQKARRSKGV